MQSVNCLSTLSAVKSAGKIVSNDTLHCAVQFNGTVPQTTTRAHTLAHPC